MTNPVMAEARALRLLLAALETDETASVESTVRVIGEADTRDELIDVILVLTGQLAHGINHSDHRRERIIFIQLRLAKLLDELGAEP